MSWQNQDAERLAWARSPTQTKEVDLNDDSWLTGPQLFRFLGVSDVCVHRWRKRPEMNFPDPAATICRRNYWRLGDVRAWQAQRREQTKRAA